MNRIASLRETALNHTIKLDEFFYRFYKSYIHHSDSDRYRKYADAFYDAFSQLTPSVSDGELIVGKITNALTPMEQKEWNETYLPLATEISRSAGGGQASHMTIDYELLLSKGINGIIAQIDTYLISCVPEKVPFYQTCRRCLEAVLIHAQNYAEEAYRCSLTATDPKRKKELLRISEICRKVPANPASDFYEAIQSVHFITYCISLDPLKLHIHQFQLGHPDRYLLPYYEKDLQEGHITKEFAQLLLDCLGIQINMRVCSGLSSGYMVGGRDADGQIVSNDLTDMCMQVIQDIRLVYPAVGLCYTKGLDEKHLNKACRILSAGHSHPAVFNDDIISKGLQSYGVSERESHSYIHSTCVEITPVASSNVWVASPYTNMPQLLLDILDREYDSFEQLLERLLHNLSESIKENHLLYEKERRTRAAHSMIPLLSCFVNNCLERGLDIECGGGKYNWTMPSFVGMANLVDALYCIRELVFLRREISIADLKKILDNNFEGNEAFRLKLLGSIPKYGNDIDDVDQYFSLITNHIISECKRHTGIYEHSRLIPSVFCWVMHERFGRETGATPDGRKAGFPLGDGSGPCQGREQNGPTASILSSTKWDHHELIGGVAVNMKFSKRSLGTHSLETMKQLIKTYMERGGFELQINVTDKDILENAVKNPEQYRDLVVRIGGYSDYFVRLSAEMQQEVILRTEHEI